MAAPLLIMLSGPNGAGKTTFYESHLEALGLPFLNADNLARETRMDAYSAAATIAAIRDQLIRDGEFIGGNLVQQTSDTVPDWALRFLRCEQR